jgi:hypothetical protein
MFRAKNAWMVHHFGQRSGFYRTYRGCHPPILRTNGSETRIIVYLSCEDDYKKMAVSGKAFTHRRMSKQLVWLITGTS